MREFGMREPSLLCLNSSLRLMQQTAGGTVRGPFCFQRGLKLCNTRLEYCRRVVVAPTVQNDPGNAAVLHEAMAWTHLVGTLLRRLSGRALQAQGATHAVFGRLCVAR